VQALDKFLAAKEKLDNSTEPSMDDIMDALHKVSTVCTIPCAFIWPIKCMPRACRA
jgi:hypothetical protein